MNKNEESILVTGPTGNIGTELVKQLSTFGAIFRAIIHLSDYFSSKQFQ
jgi:FlaA1/EpsC-like NDP-sugar epimerase